MIRFLPLFAAAAACPLLAQSSTFDLQMAGHSMGRDSYTLSKAKQGYKLSSRLSYHINGVESDISDEFRLADDYHYLEGISSNDAIQMRTSLVPNKARTDLTIGMTQGGAQDSHHLAIKPNFVLLPNFDAGAAQAVLLLATTHPTPDDLYDVVVPGAAPSHAPGAGAGPLPPPTRPPAVSRPPEIWRMTPTGQRAGTPPAPSTASP